MILPPMTDEQFKEMLRRTPRTVPTPEGERDRGAGSWVGNKIVHHTYGESRDQL